MKISVLLDVKKDSDLQLCLALLHQAIKSRPDIELEIAFNEHDIPIAKFWNAAFDNIAPDSKYILIMTSEIYLTINSLTRMLDVLESDEKTGAVGAWQNNSLYIRQNYYLEYKNLDELQSAVNDFESKTKSRMEIFLEGECLLVRRSLLDRIKQIDGEIVSKNLTNDIHCGIDLSFRILLAGFKLQVAPTFVHCQRSSVISEEEIYREEKTLHDEWGFSLLYSTFARHELLDMIQNLERDNLEILEVGCAAGGTLCEIQNRNPRAKLHGIEIDPNSARISGCFAQVENVDVEKFAPENWKEKFDYIICGDVIEHLREPWAALRNIREMLKSDGHLIASIPNIAHISIIRDLLHGDWKYVSSGILDRTHLRFFTKNSINEMFESEGLSFEIFARELPLSDEELQLAREFSERFNTPLNNFTALQWLIDAKKV